MRLSDLTPALVEARQHSREWSDRLTTEALRLFSEAVPSSETDWEPEEAWGMVLHDRQAIAYVSALFPLCFYGTDHHNAFSPIVDRLKLVSIVCSSLDEPAFRVDRAVLEEIWEAEFTPEIDLERISASDLWYLTASLRPAR